ncbi:hypothetical protein L0F63_002949 [Massospora cicadina]|nr:hypothetical protein L0F63_002949 [Massospora cicadina]
MATLFVWAKCTRVAELVRLYTLDVATFALKLEDPAMEFDTLAPYPELVRLTLEEIAKVIKRKNEAGLPFGFSDLEREALLKHQIHTDGVIDGCKAFVFAMEMKSDLIPKYLLPAVSLMMACEEELGVASNHSDNIYRSFFGESTSILTSSPFGWYHGASHIFLLLFNCVVQIHEHRPDAGDEALIHLSHAHGGTPPKVSILDDVLLGWIDVYVEHCINTRRWDLVVHLHLRATTDFSSLRHKLLDLILVTLPCYYRKLNSRLAFAVLVALYLTIAYEYSRVVCGWKIHPQFIIPVRAFGGFDPELDCADPARHRVFSDAILDRLGIGRSSRVTSSSPSNLSTDPVASLLSESEPEFPPSSDAALDPLSLCKFLLHKGLECFGFISGMHERFMTGKRGLPELDRKLVSWNTPFEIHVALCIAGADFLFTLDAYALYYELVEKLSMAWKARSAPDGSYLDAYADFSPSALYRAIYGQGVILLAYNFTKESLIEFTTLLTVFPYGAITMRLLEDEDNISLHESTTTSMYGIGEPLAFLTITPDLFAARCFKRIVISLEPYWERAFDLHILSLLHAHPEVILPNLLENVKHPHYTKKLFQTYKCDPSLLKLKSPSPSNNQPDPIVTHLTTLIHTPTPAQGWDAYLKLFLSEYLKSLTLRFR